MRAWRLVCLCVYLCCLWGSTAVRLSRKPHHLLAQALAHSEVGPSLLETQARRAEAATQAQATAALLQRLRAKWGEKYTDEEVDGAAKLQIAQLPEEGEAEAEADVNEGEAAAAGASEGEGEGEESAFERVLDSEVDPLIVKAQEHFVEGAEVAGSSGSGHAASPTGDASASASASASSSAGEATASSTAAAATPHDASSSSSATAAPSAPSGSSTAPNDAEAASTGDAAAEPGAEVSADSSSTGDAATASETPQADADSEE